MSDLPKLIIIRGPSASGKSAVAEALFRRSPRPCLLISEDSIRKMFSDPRKIGHLAARQLAESAVSVGLNNGYDVIYHGILSMDDDASTPRFENLLKVHPEENYLFYLDVSFDETVRRHKTRDKRHDFNGDAMKRWWSYSSPTYYENEIIIPESSSLANTVEIICSSANLGESSEKL